MTDNFFSYISRMRYIERWSLMRNTMKENIMEHSHMVAVIAHALAIIRRDIYGIDCNPDTYATVALYHDATEILTGDLPTPIKYYSSEIQDAYKRVEEIASEQLLKTLPEEIRDSFRPVISGDLVKSTHDLVKAADKLSAYIKCIEERRTGNDDFLSAEKQTRESLVNMHLPEVDYFMEHFIPAFELTLDELGTLEEK